MARSFALPRGPRVRLRLARIRDQPAIEELCRRLGLRADSFEIGRLVRTDPRQQIVICATALVGSAETLVGVGAIRLEEAGAGTEPEPTLLLVDGALTEGLDELLAGALTGRARLVTRTRAA